MNSAAATVDAAAIVDGIAHVCQKDAANRFAIAIAAHRVAEKSVVHRDGTTNNGKDSQHPIANQITNGLL